jgi:hypothetical protein
MNTDGRQRTNALTPVRLRFRLGRCERAFLLIALIGNLHFISGCLKGSDLSPREKAVGDSLAKRAKIIPLIVALSSETQAASDLSAKTGSKLLRLDIKFQIKDPDEPEEMRNWRYYDSDHQMRLKDHDIIVLKETKEALVEQINRLVELKAKLGDRWPLEAEALLIKLKKQARESDYLTESISEWLHPSHRESWES